MLTWCFANENHLSGLSRASESRDGGHPETAEGAKHAGHAVAEVQKVEEPAMDVDAGSTVTPVASAAADAMDIDASCSVSAPDENLIEVFPDSDGVEKPKCVLASPSLREGPLSEFYDSLRCHTPYVPFHGVQSDALMPIDSLGIIENPQRMLNDEWLEFGLL